MLHYDYDYHLVIHSNTVCVTTMSTVMIYMEPHDHANRVCTAPLILCKQCAQCSFTSHMHVYSVN